MMTPERFRWAAAVVYAHPGQKLVGRIRLQKTLCLLQRLGLPSDYDFRIHHYGPYSEGIQSDINLLNRLGLVEEAPQVTSDGRPYSIFLATKQARMDALEPYRIAIERMAAEDAVILELAATYDRFWSDSGDHDRALAALRRMKGDKCSEQNLQRAYKLLADLGLPNATSAPAN